MTQSFPAPLGYAYTARAARVSLTPDGPWLDRPLPENTTIVIYDDSATRAGFGTWSGAGGDDAELLCYVEREALQTIAVGHALVQPTEAAKPAANPALSIGFWPTPGTRVEVLAPENNGFVKVRVSSSDFEVTGLVAPSSLGTTNLYADEPLRPEFHGDSRLPENFVLRDEPDGTAFLTVHAFFPQAVQVLQRSGSFALVRVLELGLDAIGWVEATLLGTRIDEEEILARSWRASSEDGAEEGDEDGVAGVSAPVAITLPPKTPLFDRPRGRFVGVAERFGANPVETKSEWTRYILTTRFGDVSVWASK